TSPGVALVTLTATVQPPAGIVAPDASVIPVLVIVRFPTPNCAAVHVPVFVSGLIVTPAGMLSVNTDVKVSAVASVFPNVIVRVDVPFAAIVFGANAFVTVGATAVTVK